MNTAGAHVDVADTVTVDGATNIQDVSNNSFVSAGTHTSGIVVTDTDGSTIHLTGKASATNVTLNTIGEVKLAGKYNGKVILAKAANVNIVADTVVANLIVDAPGAIVRNEGTIKQADANESVLITGTAPEVVIGEDNVVNEDSLATASLEKAKAAAEKLAEADYTSTSYKVLTVALAKAETTTEEKLAKATAINNAIAGLVKQGEGTTKLQLESGKTLIFKVYGIKSGKAEAKLTKDQLGNAFVNANLEDLKAIAQVQKNGGADIIVDDQAEKLKLVKIMADNITFDAAGVLSIPAEYTGIFSETDFDVVKTTPTDYNISVYYEGATTTADRLAKITINKTNGVKFTEVKTAK
ncbi:hypothetical protein [Sporosarcina sp. ZBG7A]|uniref:hypothetical protein n=1 Tax=Sporosarcina sp. ZBG7A TaxID=1582223 RepID=UPI000AA3963C|nr:hypothetical protein [Sporosarcina sp. ZBG7A]